MLWRLIELVLVSCLLGVSWCFDKKCDCGPTVSCTVCSDDFNRSNSTDITTGSACGWTEVTGSWSIASNKLSNSDTAAIAICNTASPAAARSINVKASGDTNSKAARVIVGYVDASNYWFAQITFHASTGAIAIIQRNGGVNSTKASIGFLALPTNTMHQIQVCYDGAYLEMRVAGVAKAYLKWAATITDLDSGLGSNGTGVCTFDDWELKLRDDDCSCPIVPTTLTNCQGACLNNEASTFYQIEIDGLSSGTCNCSSYNGLWIVSQTDSDASGSSACCRWKYDMGMTNCTPSGPMQVWLELCNTSPPGHLRGFVRCAGSTGSGLAVANAVTSPDLPYGTTDCTAFDEESFSSTSVTVPRCTGTMSATVTSL